MENPKHFYVNKDGYLEGIILPNEILEVYSFEKDFSKRFRQILYILQKMVDNSNLGELLGVNAELAIELKKLLASLNYLNNSTSIEKGIYYNFDKKEIDKKLGRK